MGNKGSVPISKYSVGDKVQIYSRTANKWLDGKVTKHENKPPRVEIEYKDTRTNKTLKKTVLVDNEDEVLRKAQPSNKPAQSGDKKWGLESTEMEQEDGKPVYKRGDSVMTKNGLGTVESVSGDGRIWVRIGQKTLKKYRVGDLRLATPEQIEAGKTASARPAQAPAKTQTPTAAARPAQTTMQNNFSSNRQKSLAQHGLTARGERPQNPRGLSYKPSNVSSYSRQSNAYPRQTNMASASEFMPPTTPAKEWSAGEVERWARITLPQLSHILCKFIKDGKTLVNMTDSQLKRYGMRNEIDRNDTVYAISKLKKLEKAKSTNKPDRTPNMFQNFGGDDFPDLPDDF